jgi:hypothetical protein
VENFKEVTDALSDRQKNVEVRIKQVPMNRSNVLFISIVGHVFRRILDKNIFPIPCMFYAIYKLRFEISIHMSQRL